MHSSCMCEYYIILFIYLKSSPHQVACDWSQFPNQRLIPQPPQQKHGVLTTSHHGSPKKETSILTFYIQRVLETTPLTFHSAQGWLYFKSIPSISKLKDPNPVNLYTWYSSPNHFITFAFLQSYSSSCLPTTWRCLSKAKRSHDFVQW